MIAQQSRVIAGHNRIRPHVNVRLSLELARPLIPATTWRSAEMSLLVGSLDERLEKFSVLIQVIHG